MEREMELEVKRERKVNKNREIDPQAYEILYYKFISDERSLRVYIDEENERYFIDVFAAVVLGLMSSKDGYYDYDSGVKLFEISKETLKQLESIFKDRIIYVAINTKSNTQYYERELRPVSNPNEDNSTDYKNTFEDNKIGIAIGDDIEIMYDNYKAENHQEPFEEYLANNGYGDNTYSGHKL